MKSCPFHSFIEQSESSEPRAQTTTLNSCDATRRIGRVYAHMAGHRDYSAIPGPDHVDEVLYRTENHKYITSLHTKYGDIFKTTVNGSDFVFVRKPSTVKKVLTSEDLFDKTFADADLNSSEYIQYFKNLIQPLFASSKVFGSADNSSRRQGLKKCFMSSESMLPKFHAVCCSILKRWSSESRDYSGNGSAKCLLNDLHQLVFNMVSVIMCGDMMDTVHDELDILYEAAAKCLQHFVNRYTTPLFIEKVNTTDEAFMKSVEQAGLRVTEKCFQQFNAGNNSEVSKSSLLGVMHGLGIDIGEANTTMLNGLFAACEAPIHVLGKILDALSLDKTIQEKLHNEITSKNLFDGSGFQAINEDALADYIMEDSYLDAVVMEGLRLHSPVTLVQRRTKRNGIVLDGYHIRNNTNIGVCIQSVHSNSDNFPNPNTFDPDRTTLDMVLLDTDNCFMPFSSGPRGCPGRYLAATFVKVALLNIVKTYELLEIEKKTPKTDDTKIFKFVEYPMDGVYLNMKLR